jgi:predicted MFS family arabinose efflux permease
MALIGIGCSPALMSALYLFARTQAPARFGLLASLFIGIGSLGNLFGAAPLARLAEAFGWRPAMLVVAGIMALATVFAFLAIRNPERVGGAEARQAGWLAGLKAILTIRPLWLLMPILFFSYATVVTTRGLWIGPYLIQVGGLDKVAAGDGAFWMALAMCVGAVAYGVAEGRTGRRKALVLVGTGVTAALYLGLALTPAGAGGQAVMLMALIGGLGITYAILMAHARRFFPPALIGRGVTFANFVIIGGSAALQAWSGRLVASGHLAGIAPATTYRDMHLIFAGLLLASAAIYAFAPADPKAGDAVT